MNIGMLWFDNDSKANLTTKIDRAVTYYSTKYGTTPNLCFIHPTMLPDDFKQNGVEVRTTRSVLPNHIWLGVGDD